MTECRRNLLAYLVRNTSWAEVPVTLHYRAAEPYAVELVIGERRVLWRLGRELLRSGTAHPAGEGDVRLWPGRRASDEHLFLQVSAPSGQALLELSRPQVLAFLAETELMVPTGEEEAAMDIDAELHALLDGDAP